jgi:flagellar hook-associated protein 1 FlgK
MAIESYPATHILKSALDEVRKRSDISAKNLTLAGDQNYVREETFSRPIVHGGAVAGIEIAKVLQMVDENLVSQVRAQHSVLGEYSVLRDFYRDIEGSIFGSKSTQTTFYHRMRAMADDLRSVSADPTAASKLTAISSIRLAVDSISLAARRTQEIRGNVDKAIETDVIKANTLIKEISELNIRISEMSLNGGDVNAAINQRRRALHELAEFIPITVNDLGERGQVTVYTKSQKPLIMGELYSQLHYERASSSLPSTEFSPLTIEGFGLSGASAPDITDSIQSDGGSGRLKSLFKLRDQLLPAFQEQLDVLTAGMRDGFNAIHNLGSSTLPPGTLTGTVGVPGHSTALLGATAIAGQGTVRIGVLNHLTGSLASYVDVDLSTISNIGELNTAINAGTGLGLTASISTDGALTFALNGTHLPASQHGIVIGTAGTTEARLSLGGTYSSSSSYGFSHFFGMNNLFVTGNKIPGDEVTGIANQLSIRSDLLTSNGLRMSSGTLSSGATPRDPALAQDDVSIVESLALKLEANDVSFIATSNSGAVITSLQNYAAGMIDFQKILIANTNKRFESEEYNFQGLSTKAQELSGVDVRQEFLKLQEILKSQALVSKAFARVVEADQKMFEII